jgi:hypothetical protein
MGYWTTSGSSVRSEGSRSSEGRPSIPIETYLRLMFLIPAYDLEYERLCGAVADLLW